MAEAARPRALAWRLSARGSLSRTHMAAPVRSFHPESAARDRAVDADDSKHAMTTDGRFTRSLLRAGRLTTMPTDRYDAMCDVIEDLYEAHKAATREGTRPDGVQT